MSIYSDLVALLFYGVGDIYFFVTTLLFFPSYWIFDTSMGVKLFYPSSKNRLSRSNNICFSDRVQN